MDWPHPAEDDAYFQTELWTIERGLPGQAGKRLRTIDRKGNTIPNKAEIGKYVDEAYPVQKGAPPDWRMVGADKGKNLTNWENRVTKKQVWKASKAGDTFPGPQITKRKTLIDGKSIECP